MALRLRAGGSALPCFALSKGGKQKVGLVQALMARPELLLLDEPTSGLDPLMQREVHSLLREAQTAGATIFFSSHIIGEVGALAQRVAIIRGGTIVEETEPERLTGLALRRVQLRFTQAVDIARLLAVDGVSGMGRQSDTEVTLQVEGEMDGFIKAVATYPVRDMQTEHVSLEEVFLAYYQAGAREES